ncbi:squalene synthase HpnC [Sphaerotilus uruguayifluvii]|uniref:Squalene synthase HpnC n=1 Tax=Sphaerotilus uruguayifluvii TaxID=2735897 RepID=A0ABX2G0R4_9BURK|nr:squalene synthase HpnC [Leptothrix sp. C29]NRT55630.1 squalene synthase HpnC [Leptothrix sp. C29]
MSVDHYENFPVASVLCPPALRPAVIAIYGFARTADDLADEGDATPEQRATDLAAYREDLRRVAHGQDPSPRWGAVFRPLMPVFRRHHLPLPLLEALLDAFEQDLHQSRYADRGELLRYCERSANPVGRLLLHLYGVRDDASLTQSDAICTALQLINFWQDLSRDLPRDRLYVPLADCARYHVTVEALMAQRDTEATRALVADEVAWARRLMLDGAPLATRLPGRTGWELRLVVQGGLRILDKIEAMRCGTLAARPRIGAWDAPRLLWRAARMRVT